MHLDTVFQLAVHRYPEAEAVVFHGDRQSYAEWSQRINSVTRAIRLAGIRPGDRLALYASNSEATATMFFAAQRARATAVPLNTRWKPEELAYAVHDADIRGIFFDQHTAPAIDETIGPHSNIARFCTDDASPISGAALRMSDMISLPDDPVPNAPARAHDVATILYTSGTTGPPKGVPRTHRNDYAGVMAMITAHRWSLFERTLVAMPFYHVMGLHTLIAMVVLNGLSVIHSKFDPQSAIRAVEDHALTALYLVPTAYHDIVKHLENQDDALRHVPKLAYAGAPMSPDLVNRCQIHFQPDMFVNHYGCTEMQIIAANPDVPQKPRSAGRPGLHSRLRLVVADRNRAVGPSETVRPGTTGEIIVDASSPQAFRGYLNRPDATAMVLRSGWYFTGDLGVVDQDGDLHVVGRVDDMVVSGGENIHPQEIEEVLIDHPSVQDVAVVGLPDPRWGQVVTAFVVPNCQDLDPEVLDRFCIAHSRLARFKRPRRYVLVAAIPKSPTGKVLRTHLRDGRYTAFQSITSTK